MPAKNKEKVAISHRAEMSIEFICLFVRTAWLYGSKMQSILFALLFISRADFLHK